MFPFYLFSSRFIHWTFEPYQCKITWKIFNPFTMVQCGKKRFLQKWENPRNHLHLIIHIFIDPHLAAIPASSLWCHQLTSSDFWQFEPFFFAVLFQLHQVGCRSLFSHFQIALGFLFLINLQNTLKTHWNNRAFVNKINLIQLQIRL